MMVAPASGGSSVLRKHAAKRSNTDKKNALVPLLSEGSSTRRKPFAKKDLIEAVRRMGPLSLSASTSRLELARSSSAGSNAARSQDDSEIGSQLRVMETGVNTTERRYNELKIQADRKALELQMKLDTLAMLKVENDALTGMREGRTPESERIEVCVQCIVSAAAIAA
jgi:hypothetical protein